MKRRCVIHFGMHKTGSSSIQESLFRYAENLPDWHYLHVSSANLSGAVATAFGDHPTQYHANRKRGLTETEVNARAQEIRSKLTEQLQASTKPGLLLSAEDISVMSHAGLLRLVDWLASQVDDIQAVGYIRAPGAYAASAFQQRVKGGELNQLNLPNLIPRYRDRFEVFDQVLGRDRVQFWKFNPAAFPGGCVVRDFCNRLSISLPETHIIRVNEGLSKDAVCLLYAYCKYGPGYGVGSTVIAENNRLVRKLARLPGPKLQFATKALEPALQIRREQITWMEDRLETSLEEPLVDHPDAIQNETDLLRFSPESVHWLTKQLAIDFIASPTPEMIAEWMHALRLKLTQDAHSASRVNRQSESPVQRITSVPCQKKIKTLYLHIGTEKTGTTTLQNFLNKNRDALAIQGIAYPKSPGLSNHRKLMTYCLDNAHIDDAIRNDNLIDLAKREEWRSSFIKYFINEMVDLSLWATTVIISSEHGHSRLISPNEIQKLYEVLNPFFDQIKVIVYLRRQDQLAVSYYSTKIKGGATTLEVFKAAYADKPYYNYQLLLKCWSNAFGKDAVLSRVYDRSRLICGSIIDDFAAQIGLNTAGFTAIKDRKTALSTNALEILRIFNNQVPANSPRQILRPLHNRLIALLESSNAPPYRPVCAEAMAFYRLFEQSNATVAHDWFAGQPLFDDNFSSYPEKLPVITIDKKAVSEILSSAISRLVKYEGSQAALAPISPGDEISELIQLAKLMDDQSSDSTHSACKPKAVGRAKNSIDEKPFILGLEFKNLNFQLTTEDLCKITSKNTGNFVFHYAIDLHFGNQLESISQGSKLEEINSQKGYAILPCANQIGEHTDLNSSANHFSHIDRPIVAIGLGAQSSSITVIPQIAQGTIRWVKEIISHAPSNYPNIGVRGEFTRRVLEQYGLGNHIEVIGCPSLFINPSPHLGQKIYDRIRPVRRVAVAAGSFRRNHLANLEKSLVDLVTKTEGAYIIQNPLEMIKIARGEIYSLPKTILSRIRNYAWPQMSEEEFIRWAKIYARCFFNIPDWMNYLRQFDFVIGTRIHGIVLAMQAEVPALCIVHDSRTLELCETMKVPFVCADQVLEGVSINDIPQLFNFDPDAFDKNRVKLAQNYVNFLQNNHLRPNRLFAQSESFLELNQSPKKPEKFFISSKAQQLANSHKDYGMSMVKKPTLHIHIGKGKTGTTAIQKALQDNADFLKEHDLFYLGICFENLEKRRFKWNIQDGSDQFFGLPSIEAQSQLVKNLDDAFIQADQQSSKQLIWSNEWLFERLDHIIEAIKKNYNQCNLHIIVYLRRQDRWILSAYKQWGIKHKTYPGKILPFHQWYEQRFGKEQLNYFEILNSWKNALPEARFSIRIYDQCPDVCADFFNVVGIDYSKLPHPVGRFYETPNDWILSYFALFNGLFDQPISPSELEPLLRRSGLFQIKSAPEITDFGLPSQDFLTQLLDQYKESNAQLAETFSTSDYAVAFDDAPAVAAKPMQMADPHSLIAGLLLMVQNLDKEVRNLRTQVSELKKSVRSSTVPSSTPDITRIQVVESAAPAKMPDTHTVRIAIGIRTHSAETQVLNLAEQQGFGDGYDVFWLADETAGSLDLPGFPKLAHRLEDFAAMGLPTAGPRPLWYYSDYPLYRFFRDAPGYDYYLMLDYSTLTKPEFFQQLGTQLKTVKPDFIACRFTLRKPEWYWWENAHIHFDEVYGALFSLVVISPRAIAKLREMRLKLASTLADGERGVFCEAFAPSMLMQSGYPCLDLNSLIPNAWSPNTFTVDKPIWIEETSRLMGEQSVLYPVLEGADYVAKMKDWMKRRPATDGKATAIATSCFGTPLPPDLVKLNQC